MSIVAACVVPHPPLLIPGVGDPEKQQVLATKKAYEQVGSFLAELMPQTIVLFSPHATMLHDYFHISPGKGAQGCFDQFGTRGAEQRYQADYDTEFAQTLAALAQDKGIPAGGLRERMPQLDHGTMVPWHFIAPCLREPALLVRVGLSGRGVEDHFAFGACVANTAEALCRRTVVVASGDLSHRLTREGPYGYAEQGPQ
ncbi:MAG: AmmeMemoRadiSam system protein A, partial [Coriobacteriaceae bacterium]|nr:AmmeMemoRadiSam system protein A [Coriobacteriaceae bacterium]